MAALIAPKDVFGLAPVGAVEIDLTEVSAQLLRRRRLMLKGFPARQPPNKVLVDRYDRLVIKEQKGKY
ncbi:MAG: hypothetical protein JST01_19910 [Cyanobacteria bacterium SZAS TMP-1]|nr:hypothetical protein [Cyanobacteria bacterium SZAS TMP-1]